VIAVRRDLLPEWREDLVGDSDSLHCAVTAALAAPEPAATPDPAAEARNPRVAGLSGAAGLRRAFESCGVSGARALHDENALLLGRAARPTNCAFAR
jgi:hypothetical protein